MLKSRLVYALWLLMCLALWFFENNAGTRAVLAFSAAVPAFSVICACICRNRMSVGLTAPMSAREGETFTAELVTRGSGLTGFCSLSTAVTVVNSLDTNAVSEIQVKGRFQIASSYPGTLTLRLEGASLSDWFGLVRFGLPASETRVKVRPWLTDIDIELSGEALNGCEAETASRGGMDFSGVREYMPGDPVRLMHWKLTEKLDKPLVREAYEENSTLLLLLDTFLPESCEASARADALRLFLSCAWELTGMNVPFTAAIPGTEPQVSYIENGDDYAVLEDAALTAEFCVSQTGGLRDMPESGFCREGMTVLVFSPCDTAGAHYTDGICRVIPVTAHENGNTEAAVLQGERNRLVI